MTDKRLLKELMKNSHYTISKMAKDLGISRQCFFKKINGITEFKQTEILNISKRLNLSNEQIYQIFFAIEYL